MYCERFTGTSASCVVPVWKKEEQNHTGCGESLVWFCFFVSRKQKSSLQIEKGCDQMGHKDDAHMDGRRIEERFKKWEREKQKSKTRKKENQE